MKKAKPPVTYETRYKHKLNMLEPGTAMLKWIGLLLTVGFVLRLFRLKLVLYIVCGLAGAVFLILLILLAVEAHQDSVLNEIAAKEHWELIFARATERILFLSMMPHLIWLSTDTEIA